MVVLVSLAHDGDWAVVARLLAQGGHDAACDINFFEECEVADFVQGYMRASSHGRLPDARLEEVGVRPCGVGLMEDTAGGEAQGLRVDAD